MNQYRNPFDVSPASPGFLPSSDDEVGGVPLAQQPATVSVRLTARQKYIIRALFNGATPKQLAHEIDAYPQAIYDCLAKVRRKLGVTNDIQLGVAFDRMGLL